ncbi:MAG: chromosomal replication initiator protein DnaA [Clostridia bacterium]|nr:chromosomal replication initiator protein DnaA [Clostridia bacterium]
MDSNKAIWDHVLDFIRKSGLPAASFSIWFKDLRLEKFTDSFTYLSAGEYYRADFIFKTYYKKLQIAIYEVLGARTELVIFSREKHSKIMQEAIEEHERTGLLPDDVFCKVESNETFAKEEPLTEEERIHMERPVGTMIRTAIPSVHGQKYSFDNFIVGETNRMAHDACLAIAKNPAEVWNPLFLYAPSGMGKTHLLYAISNAIIDHNPTANVLYVRGEDYTNELINELTQRHPMRYFRERYRNVDVLLVDDIQFIAGKASTQEEFFNTFEALYQQHKQIILTCDRPPKDIKHLDTRLRTRFEWGLTVDIQPPELELRIAIAKSKAAALGLQVPDNVLFYVADNIKSSVRQLEGVITRLQGYSILGPNQKIDLELAKKCINDLVPKQSVDSTVERTFDRVSSKYHVGVSEITGNRRQANIVTARHVATYILRQITDLSSIEIARYFSQDHSTILSAIKSVERKIDENPAFEDEVVELIREIRE